MISKLRGSLGFQAALLSLALILLVSSSFVSTAATPASVNCRIQVCAYVRVAGAVSVVFNHRAIKTISTAYAESEEEGWDYFAGVIAVPADQYPGSVAIINVTTNTVISQLKSATFEGPNAALYNPLENVILVANSGGSTLSVINGTTLKVEPKTIGAGIGPAYLAYNPVNREIYVADTTNPATSHCERTVTVLNASTDELIKTLKVGLCPSAISFNPENDETYIASGYSQTVSVLNLSDQIIKTFRGFNSSSAIFGLNYGNGNTYVFDYTSTVTMFNSQNKITRITVLNSTAGGAYDRMNGYEYVLSGLYVQILIGTKLAPYKIYEPLGPVLAIVTTTAPTG